SNLIKASEEIFPGFPVMMSQCQASMQTQFNPRTPRFETPNRVFPGAEPLIQRTDLIEDIAGKDHVGGHQMPGEDNSRSFCRNICCPVTEAIGKCDVTVTVTLHPSTNDSFRVLEMRVASAGDKVLVRNTAIGINEQQHAPLGPRQRSIARRGRPPVLG